MWTAEKQQKNGESNSMLCLTAESENCRMVEVGRAIWSNPPAQEGTPRANCSGWAYQDRFLISPRMETPPASQFLPNVQREHSVFQFVPIAP